MTKYDGKKKMNYLCTAYSPIMITACIVIMLLVVFVIDCCYDVYFVAMINEYELLFNTVRLRAYKRIILYVISAISVFPYLITFQHKNKADYYPEWKKTGLIVGIVGFLIASISMPQNHIIDFFDKWFAGYEGIDTTGFFERFDSVLQFDTVLSNAQQNRLLFSCVFNLLLPVDLIAFCLTLEEHRKRRLPLWLTCISVCFALLSALFLDPRICDFASIYIILSVLFCILSFLICCFISIKNKTTVPIVLLEKGNSRKKYLFWGSVLALSFFINAPIQLVQEYRGTCTRLPWFSEKEYRLCFTFGMLILLLCCIGIIDRHKGKEKNGLILQIIPLLLLIWLGVVWNKSLGVCIESGQSITAYANQTWMRIPLSEVNNADIWYMDGIACLIYTLYLLYDYGMKEKPILYLIIPLSIVILSYIPDFTVKLINVSFVAFLDMAIGAIPPILLASLSIQMIKQE